VINLIILIYLAMAGMHWKQGSD